MVATGASSCKSPVSITQNFTVDIPYDPCLAPNLPDSFLSFTRVAKSENWTAKSGMNNITKKNYL